MIVASTSFLMGKKKKSLPCVLLLKCIGLEKSVFEKYFVVVS